MYKKSPTSKLSKQTQTTFLCSCYSAERSVHHWPGVSTSRSVRSGRFCFALHTHTDQSFFLLWYPTLCKVHSLSPLSEEHNASISSQWLYPLAWGIRKSGWLLQGITALIFLPWTHETWPEKIKSILGTLHQQIRLSLSDAQLVGQYHIPYAALAATVFTPPAELLKVCSGKAVCCISRNPCSKCCFIQSPESENQRATRWGRLAGGEVDVRYCLHNIKIYWEV